MAVISAPAFVSHPASSAWKAKAIKQTGSHKITERCCGVIKKLGEDSPALFNSHLPVFNFPGCFSGSDETQMKLNYVTLRPRPADAERRCVLRVYAAAWIPTSLCCGGAGLRRTGADPAWMLCTTICTFPAIVRAAVGSLCR